MQIHTSGDFFVLLLSLSSLACSSSTTPLDADLDAGHAPDTSERDDVYSTDAHGWPMSASFALGAVHSSTWLGPTGVPIPDAEMTGLVAAAFPFPVDDLLGLGPPSCAVQARAGLCSVVRCDDVPELPINYTFRANIDGGPSLSTGSGDEVEPVDGILFEPGQRVTIEVEGDLEFTTVLAAPRSVRATFPEAWRPGDALTLPLAYLGAPSEETLHTTFFMNDTLVLCESAPSGVVTISAELLRHLEPGIALISVQMRNQVTLDAGGFGVVAIVSHSDVFIVDYDQPLH